MAVTFVTLSLIPKRSFSINFLCVLFFPELVLLFDTALAALAIDEVKRFRMPRNMRI